MIINDFEKINVNVNTKQMEQLTKPGNVIKYPQCNRNPIDYYKLDIKALESKCYRRIYQRLEEEDRQIIDFEFGERPEKIKLNI